MNNRNKNELENLKREAQEFKDSLLHVLRVLFFMFAMTVSVWMIWELIKILIIDNLAEVFQTTFGIIFWIIIALVAIAIKRDWWDKRQERMMWKEINADLHSKNNDTKKSGEEEELQVIFFGKNPTYPKPKDNKDNE